MVGYNLITKQTPEDGVLVNKVNELFCFSLLFQVVKLVKCKRNKLEKSIQIYWIKKETRNQIWHLCDVKSYANLRGCYLHVPRPITFSLIRLILCIMQKLNSVITIIIIIHLKQFSICYWLKSHG